MIELLPYILLGISIGTVAGLIPGVGIFVSLMLIYPLLMDMSLIQLLITYTAIASTTQYIGSVSAIFLGVPGESSSLPAVKEGHALYLKGQGHYAISTCALGSFFGSLICVFIFWLAMDQVYMIYAVYDTFIQAFVLLIVSFILLFVCNNFMTSLFLAGFGYFLGMIGSSPLDQNSTFLAFGNPDLILGLPTFSVLLALFVIPELFKDYNEKTSDKNIKLPTQKISKHLSLYFRHFASSLRGTVIGFFGGLTPGLTTVVSSNLAYAYEVWHQKRKKKYSENGDLNSLISAETANNAGSFASLLPLIVLGIPISPSEAIVFDLVSMKGFALGFSNFTPELFLTLAICLIIINLICLIISWPIVKYFQIFYMISFKYLRWIIMAILLIILYVIGVQSWQEWYYITVFLVLCPIGYTLRNVNTLPLIFAFILQDRLEIVLTRIPPLIAGF